MRESRLLLLALALLRAALAQTALGSAQLLGQAPQYQQHNNILHFVVPEGAPNGTYLGNIHSADGQPPYLILPAPQTPESERVAALTVNLFNGNLTTNGVLDREHREQYHFVAIVKEPFAEIKCTVTVKDINDNAPMFLMPNANETNFVIEMPENQRGIRKLLPLAIDFDTPQFGIKEFRIVSGNTPTGTFQLVEHEAPARSSLNQAINPDPDLASSMLAAGADSLSPQLIQQLAQQATVLIPSQPMMQSNTQQLSPNLPPALAMANAPAIQSISSSPTKFLIDLELSQMLDRENQSSYQLVVEAIDGGQPPLLGRLMVTVNVLDVNDNDPIFTRKIYECHFREDTAKGTLLIRVQAYDADLDSNGQVSYFIKRISSSSQPVNSINSSSSDNNNFSENSSSFNGRPFSNSNISKQQQQRAQQITTTNVVGNKLAPQRQPSSGNNDFYDTTSSGMNDQSQTFRAVKQQNFGSPQQVADQPQQQSQLFEIDPFKGEIYLVHSLDYETDQMHEITIEARDHGKPSRSSQAVVKVYVIDFYDDPPKKPLIQANPSSEASRSELAANGRSTVAFPLCLVKIKSRQPESDYNDTAGLTLASNNGQTKPSPNHSTSNEYSNGGNGNELNHREHLSTLSNRQQQLPPTPCTVSNVNAFPWPPQPSGSTPGCCSAIHGTLGSTLDCSPIMMPPQWSELAATPQPAYGLDFHGPYTWDYLNDWTPGYQNMMELLQNHLGSTLGGFNAEQVQMRGCQAS